MVTVSAVATDLFLGGWHGPFLPEWLGWIWFLLKVGFLLFFYIWMRWTLPRYRYDQLMAFGWKWLLPVAVVNLLVTAAPSLYFGAGWIDLLPVRGRRGRRVAARGHRAAEPDVQRAAADRVVRRAVRLYVLLDAPFVAVFRSSSTPARSWCSSCSSSCC